MRITKSVLFQALIVFILLMLNYISLPMSGGENQYLAFAKQFSNPSWIPDSFSLTEFPGTRLIFQYLFGGILNILEMDLCALLFRTLNFALVSLPLVLIFRKIELKFFEGLFVLQIFLTGQSLLGQEWIIGTFEPKTMAYVFFLWAFFFWLKRKHYLVAIMAVLTCYFHIIVGGWFLIALMLIEFWNGGWKEYLKPALLFAVLISPFLFYLIPTLLSPDNGTGVLSANQIYVYYRLPHHLGIASTWDSFVNRYLDNALMVLVAFLIGIIFFKKNRVNKMITQWFIICFSISVLYIFISIIDGVLLEKSASFGLKFYPFRLNSFGYLLFLFAIILWVKKLNFYKKYYKHLSILLFALSFIIGGVKFSEGIAKDQEVSSNYEYWEMVRKASELSSPRDQFVLNTNEQTGYFYDSFSRLSGRENFSIHKFVPAEKDKIYKWHERQLALKRLKYERISAKEICEKYSIDFIINQEALDEESFSLVFNNKSYFIYKYIDD